MGSEMCIRDSQIPIEWEQVWSAEAEVVGGDKIFFTPTGGVLDEDTCNGRPRPSRVFEPTASVSVKCAEGGGAKATLVLDNLKSTVEAGFRVKSTIDGADTKEFDGTVQAKRTEELVVVIPHESQWSLEWEASDSSTPDGEVITGGSAFNIKAKSLRLGNFSEAEVRRLFEQHTTATGQVFDEVIFAELWQDTYGQPWLVNALGHELTWRDRSARDRNTPISLEQYWAARERLIESRATHLDQLADKLQEPRVHRVVAPLLHGDADQLEAGAQDFQYVIDLGLIERTVNKQVRISNRIYQEIIPRELNLSLIHI